MGRRAGLPTVYRRGDSTVYWCSFTVNGKRHRLCTGARAVGAAEKAAQTFYAEVSLGRSPGSRRRVGVTSTSTFELMAAEYLVYERASGRAESYIVKQESHLVAHFNPRWKRLSSITSAAIEQYKVERAAEVSSVTVYKELVTLSKFLKWAKRTGYLHEVPTFERPKPVSDYMPVTLSPAEARDLVDELPDRRTHPRRMAVREFFLLQWTEGMRPGEVGTLRWGDVDLRRREITVRQSNDKARAAGGRTIAMTDDAHALLAELAEIPHPRTSLVFGRHDYRTSIENAIERLNVPARYAGAFPHLTPHGFRHARITEMASSTKDTAAVQYHAGHKSLATTDRYVKSRVERTRAVFDAIKGAG